MLKFIGSPESNLELDVESFKIIQVTDFNNGFCDVMVELKNDSIRAVWIHTFAGFQYFNDIWETNDIENFITDKLTP